MTTETYNILYKEMRKEREMNNNPFQIGQWVRVEDNRTILKVVSDVDEYNHYNLVRGKEKWRIAHKNLKLWQPQVGEWCWFGLLLVRIEAISECKTTYILYTKTSDGTEHRMVEADCKLEPFIGELPSFIKEK